MSDWVPLGQPLFNGINRSPAHGDVSFWVDEHDRTGMAGPQSVRVTHMEMATHVGTHIDAARHFIPDGRTIDQYPPEAFRGEGAVLDVAREGVVPVTAADLEEAGAHVRSGDIVLLSFGYAARLRLDGYHDHPYLTRDAAEWLLERRVRIVGVDTITPDLPGHHRRPDYDFPAHMELLGNDILIIENLGPGVTELADRRVEMLAAPVVIEGADAAPLAPLARALA